MKNIVLSLFLSMTIHISVFFLKEDKISHKSKDVFFKIRIKNFKKVPLRTIRNNLQTKKKNKISLKELGYTLKSKNIFTHNQNQFEGSSQKIISLQNLQNIFYFHPAFLKLKLYGHVSASLFFDQNGTLLANHLRCEGKSEVLNLFVCHQIRKFPPKLFGTSYHELSIHFNLNNFPLDEDHFKIFGNKTYIEVKPHKDMSANSQTGINVIKLINLMGIHSKLTVKERAFIKSLYLKNP